MPWQDYVYAADVVLSAPDATATAIDLTAPLPMQVARGSMVSDDAGARRATLLFPQGTQASFRLADGTTQPAPTPLTIRQTEYTVGATGVLAMPAGLPPSSAYTYNVELSADEERAAGAIGVVFNQPVIFYVENFIGFPVGEHAPAGFYDRQASAWKGEPDGRVVEVVAIAAGAAALDTDGDGSADNGIGTGIAGADLGITLAERQQLATLYAVGQTLWRVTITHFSPLDLNWGGGPTPPGAIPPGEPVQPRNHNDDDVPCPECATQKRASGSIIEIPNQTLGEEIDVVGTGMTLNYRSDRTPGRRASYQIDIPIVGPTVPPNLISVIVEISVAGQHHVHSFPPVANQRYTFEWDGKDGYGRPVLGGQTAWIRMINGYPTAYQVARDPNGRSWALSDALVRATPLTLTPATLVREFRVPHRCLGWARDWPRWLEPFRSPRLRPERQGTVSRQRRSTAGDRRPGPGHRHGRRQWHVRHATRRRHRRRTKAPATVPDTDAGGARWQRLLRQHRGGLQDLRWNPDGTITHIAGTSNGNNPRVGVPARDAWSLRGYLQVRWPPMAVSSSLTAAITPSGGFARPTPLWSTSPGRRAWQDSAATGGPRSRPSCRSRADWRSGRMAVSTSRTTATNASAVSDRTAISPPLPAMASDAAPCSAIRRASRDNRRSPRAVAAGGSDTIVVGPDGSVYGTRGATIGTGSELFRVGADGILTVIAGKRDLPQSEAEGVAALNANMTLLQSFALNPDGSIWYTVLAGFNSKWQVRRIDMVTRTVRTIGGGAAGFGGDGGPALGANLAGAAALEFTPDGALLHRRFDQRSHSPAGCAPARLCERGRLSDPCRGRRCRLRIRQ